MIRHRLNEEIKDLSPREAAEKANREGSLTDVVELEDPSSVPPHLSYNEAEDPEIIKEFNESIRNAFNSASAEISLREATKNGFSLKDAISDYIRANKGNIGFEDFEDFYDSKCSEGYTDFGTEKNKEFVRQKFEAALESIGIDADMEPLPEKEFDLAKTSERTQNMVKTYVDFKDDVLPAEETAEAKYDAIYDTIANILEGTSFKKHAFICGDAGVGKCAVGETKVTIRVDDIIAEEIVNFVKANTKTNTKTNLYEIDISLKALYEFIATKAKKEQKYDEFIDVTFELELKGKDGFEKCSAFIKKQAPTVKIITENGKSFEGADKHILMLEPEIDKGIYLENCDVGTEIPYLNDKIKTVEFSDKLTDVYSPSMDLSHMYHDVNGFIHHNTYSVKKCKEELWDSSPLKAQGWEYMYAKGDVGTSIAPITAFFFERRDRKVIVLDDADAFLKDAGEGSPVMNLFKGMLNTENTLQNPEPITIRPTITKIAAKYLKNPEKALVPTQQEIDCGLVSKFAESTKERYWKFDRQAFKEGRWKILIDGKVLYDEAMSPEEIGKYKLVEQSEYEKHILERKKNSIYGLTLREADDFENNDILEGGGLLDDYNPDNEIIGGAPEVGDELPTEFCFTSRLIMISNMNPSMVNDAFRSRCDVIPITLTHEEFIAHCKVVIPGLMLNLETSLPQGLIIKIRDLMYGYAYSIIELEGQQLFGQTIKINLPLQFRLFSEMAGKWLAQAQAYARKNNIKLSEETFPLFEKAIERRFLQTFAIPMFADNQYTGGGRKRR